jgi:hypothetical protein
VFPEPGLSHEERLDVARALARATLDVRGEAVLAIMVTSSTARDLDRQ